MKSFCPLKKRPTASDRDCRAAVVMHRDGILRKGPRTSEAPTDTGVVWNSSVSNRKPEQGLTQPSIGRFAHVFRCSPHRVDKFHADHSRLLMNFNDNDHEEDELLFDRVETISYRIGGESELWWSHSEWEIATSPYGIHIDRRREEEKMVIQQLCLARTAKKRKGDDGRRTWESISICNWPDHRCPLLSLE